MQFITKNLFFVIFFSLFISFTTPTYAQDSIQSPPQTFYKAQVEGILTQGADIQFGMKNLWQEVKLKILNGDMANQEITLFHGKNYTLDQNQLVTKGEIVVIVKTTNSDTTIDYQITDKYRLDTIFILVGIFFLLVIALSRWQGLGSLLGMIFSLGVILKFIIPQILAGQDPLLISILGCLAIMIVTLYLAHGFSTKTTIALLSTFLTLVTAGLISILLVNLTKLTGLGSEDAYSLKLGPTANINFKGLLLGGMLIGALGVLDDVTTSLSASVFEIAKANPKFKFKNTFASALVIGKEHIASLVNTLVLAYAGASLPIFITLVLNPNNYPLWSIINSELIIEEVVRTLGGSIGLIMAVPLTAFLASFYVSRHHT